jgi:hypothetical protein
MPTVRIQPDSSNGKDTYVSSKYTTESHENDTIMSADSYESGLSQNDYPMIRFDLSGINGVIKNADIGLSIARYQNESSSSPSRSAIRFRKINSDWNENVTFDNRPDWEYSDSVLEKVIHQESYPGNPIWESTSYENALISLLNEWVSGTTPNHGLYLMNMTYLSYAGFYTSEYTDASKRPYLEITYNEPPTKPSSITSPLLGNRWTGNQIVRWGAATDTDSFSTQLQYQGEISYDNGVTWNPLFPLTSQGVLEKQVDFTQYPETNQAKVRVRAYDGELYGNWETSQSFIINHNLSPNAPSKLTPSNGTVVDFNKLNRFSWQHNDVNGDPQQSYDLYYRLQGSGTWTKASGTTLNQYHDFASNTFTEGIWEWKVVTYDEEFASPDSQIAVFEVRTKPTVPTFTNPTNNEVIITAQPTVSWSSSTQTGYQLKVKQNGNSVWFVNEDGTNISRQLDYLLSDNSNYTLELRIKNQYGLLSDVATITIITDYVEPPKPIMIVSEGTGHIVIDISNPDPVGEQPTLSYNDVYKMIGGEWVRIATNLPVNSQFRDYSVQSGKTHEYKVRAIGDNFTFVDSETGSASTKLRGVWLHEVTDPEQTIEQFKVDGGGRNSSVEIASALMNFKGRKHPVMETEESYNYVINFNLTLINEVDRERLERLVYSRNILCYRDGRGRISYGILTILPLSDEAWGGQTTSLQLIRIDYQEGV